MANQTKEAIINQARLSIIHGDITRQTTDAIVNAANPGLMGGGGVDGAIHRAGGPAILEECETIRRDKYPNGLPAGGAVVTGGGHLPARHVIHTVGPIWRGGKSGEAEQLASAYRESMNRGEELKAETIAFPAISTGVYGYPKEQASQVAYKTLASFLQTHEYPNKVFLVFFNSRDAQIFLATANPPK